MSDMTTGRRRPRSGPRRVVVEEQPAQVFAVHAEGHARLVGVPGHQVEHRPALAHQVVVDHARPDQVVGAQQLEGAGHLPGVEEALLPHHVLEEGDLALVDEQHQLAGLGEIGLGGEQGHGGQPVVAVARHLGARRWQQRAAEAIADRVDLGRPARSRHRVERFAMMPSVR
jgi:hypothetical protein